MDDNIFRIDADRESFINLIELKLFNEIFDSLYPDDQDESDAKKLKACIRVFVEHGIPLSTAIEIIKEMGDEMAKVDGGDK